MKIQLKLTIVFVSLILFRLSSVNAQTIEILQEGPTHETVQFVSSTTGYAIAYALPNGSFPNGVLRKTTDGGSSWTTSPITFSPTYSDYGLANSIYIRNKLQFLNESIGFCAGYLYSQNGNVENPSVILKTTNGGASWAPLFRFDNAPINDFFFFNENNGFLTIEDKIYKTTNGGLTYQTVYQNPVISQACQRIYFYNSNIGFVASTNRIHKTIDGGNTWTTINLPLGITPNYFFFVSESTGFFTTISNGRLYKTIDGGQNWALVLQEANTALSNFQKINQKIAISGYPASISSSCPIFLYNSTDNGNTWTKQCLTIPNYNANIIVDFLSSYFLTPDLAYFGVSGRLLRYSRNLSTENWKKNESAFLYPNPAKDKVYIKFNRPQLKTEYNYEIFDSLGKKVLFGKINTENGSIYIRNLTQGVYFLKIRGINSVYKILKQ